MNGRLITYGKIFRLCAMHWLARAIQPSANVRVTYTHEVKCENMENFDRIVHYLRQCRTILSPEDFLSAYADRQFFDAKFLVMTFDDGLLSSYHATREVLDRYGIKAIFFIPTAILDLKTEDEMRHFAAEKILYNSHVQKLLTPDEFQFMTAEHLLELAANGHMICPHTHSHTFLQDIRDKETVQRELVRPKEILKNILHRKINAFAFPLGTEKQVGYYTYDWIRKHYDFCFTALNGINTLKTDPYRLHRDCLPADAHLSYVRMVMEGTYDLYYMLKMSRLKKRQLTQTLVKP